ncbi:hypothetical protein [Alteribacillus sp. YIM 98480]|nr:hypothetical protein [Alteribacillus sp. YIM 98480]
MDLYLFEKINGMAGNTAWLDAAMRFLYFGKNKFIEGSKCK